MKGTVSGKWCILRTSGPKTLPLAASLTGAGIEAWTPTAIIRQRVRLKRKRLEHPAPITPTFVFVRADRLPDLAAILAAPKSPHPSFSLFQWAGRFPLIADSDIAGLRSEEAAAAEATATRHRAEAVIAERGEKDAHRKVIPVGSEIMPSQGPFAGMTGVVESGDRKAAWVNFGGTLRVKIDTWLLASDAIGQHQS